MNEFGVGDIVEIKDPPNQHTALKYYAGSICEITYINGETTRIKPIKLYTNKNIKGEFKDIPQYYWNISCFEHFTKLDNVSDDEFETLLKG